MTGCFDRSVISSKFQVPAGRLARAEKSCAAWKNAVIGLKGGLEKGQRYVTYADALKCEHKHRMKSGIASLFVNVFCSETVARLLARRFVFELRVE